MLGSPRIIDVYRKPSKCPACGERVVDIIYGTGDMSEIDKNYDSNNRSALPLAEQRKANGFAWCIKKLTINSLA